MQVRGWVDEAAAAAALLGQTVFAARPGVHAVHIAAEMVPLAKVRWLGRGVRVEDGQTDRQTASLHGRNTPLTAAAQLPGPQPPAWQPAAIPHILDIHIKQRF